MRSRYCKECGGWHDLAEPWPHDVRHVAASIQVIKDIEPYAAVAVDVATGKPPRIGGRRQHREFLRRNGYVEVGNERIGPKKVDYGDVTPQEVKELVDRARNSR